MGNREGRVEKIAGEGEDDHLAGGERGKDSDLALALVGAVYAGVSG